LPHLWLSSQEIEGLIEHSKQVCLITFLYGILLRRPSFRSERTGYP
jgi:hypothetical protein